MSNATLTLSGKSIELPVNAGSEGETYVSIDALRQQTGAITLDWGYGNTGSCESAVTFLDGEQGVLRYRGYPIEQLCESSTFMEVSWLLNHGELPTPKALQTFEQAIVAQTSLPENFKQFISAFPRDAHPMSMLSAGIMALSTHHQNQDTLSADGVTEATHRLMGAISMMAAWGYQHNEGKSFANSNPQLDYCSNFLQMMFSDGDSSYKVHEDVKRALDLLWILHADHEQNCSTSTVRMVGSSQANLYASISAGIAALWGPLHGGANQAVLEMLDSIAASGDSAAVYLDKVKDKKSSIRLMGFGHRVYKNFDPRAVIIKKAVDKVLQLLGVSDPLLEVAKGLEEVALRDDYFVSRKLYPNVDFYSGILYRAMGIPVNMFTVMFAIGRLPGWVAHFKEMNESPKNRICRPRQIYTGANMRPYVPQANR